MRPSRRSAAACMAMPRPAVLLPLLMLWAALLVGACPGASCCCSRLLLRRHGAAVTICSNMQACWLCGSRAGLHVCWNRRCYLCLPSACLLRQRSWRRARDKHDIRISVFVVFICSCVRATQFHTTMMLVATIRLRQWLAYTLKPLCLIVTPAHAFITTNVCRHQLTSTSDCGATGYLQATQPGHVCEEGKILTHVPCSVMVHMA